MSLGSNWTYTGCACIPHAHSPIGLRLATPRCAEAMYPGALAFDWMPALALVYPTLVVNGFRGLPLSRTGLSLANGACSAMLVHRTV